MNTLWWKNYDIRGYASRRIQNREQNTLPYRFEHVQILWVSETLGLRLVESRRQIVNMAPYKYKSNIISQYNS